MSLDAAELKGLSAEEKRRLLSELMARRSQRIEEEFPATAGQRALWFLQMQSPASVAYNIILAGRLRGPLDVGALSAALHDLAMRHATLRTTYYLRGGELLQVVAREIVQPFAQVDVSEYSERALLERVETDAHQPFNLTTGPVFLARLYTRAPEDHVFLLVVHHIAIDGLSMDVAMEELREIYLARAAGCPPPPHLCGPGASYIGHAEWELALLESPDGERMWRYWQEALAGDIPELTLPPARMPGQPLPARPPGQRPLVQTFDGEEHIVMLDDDVASLVREFAKTKRVTLYTLLLSGFFALVHRYTHQRDLCVGSFVAGRPRPELERAVGYYINTVPLRVQIEPESTFAELLEQVHQRVMGALDHKDFPFATLVQRLQPPRGPSRSPLFDLAFNWLSAGQFETVTSFFIDPSAEPQRAGSPFQLSPYPIRRRFARFDLELEMTERGAGIAAYIQYNTAVLDEPAVACLMVHLQQLLRGALRRPDAPIHEHPLLSAAEHRQIVAEWNRESLPPPPAQCLHQLFEAQAQRSPDAVAVRSQRETLSYRALDERANHIAGLLHQRGVGLETRVAVCSDRSVHMVSALLGVLKAGAAYVPLDPAYPKERIRYMIEDSGATLVLTTAAAYSACKDAGAPALLIDEHSEPRLPAPEVPVTPEHLAYVIYTSGSTGRPKGVEMRHRGCAPLFQWASSTFPREDFSATLASTSVCFDVSVFELFYPLSVGGTLILVDSALHVLDLDPGSPVTSIITVPSALGAMVDLARFPASVRALYLAGEPLRRSLVDRIYKQTGVDRIYNIYGPTENTVYSTWSSVRREDTGEPTIGRPLPGCRAYVLDDTQQPVPVLHVGELVLGGAGVARGYRGRPELTSERFVPDPFAAEPGARMYRTGDLARFRPDGEIELLGRRDSQIKLHGYRIELGEIEAALSQHPDVIEAAVRAQEHRGGRRLVGYLSPRPAFQGGPEALSAAARAHLERVLPPYMIPPILIVLPDLPRTPNGKLDRSRLPDWEEEPAVDHATTLYPRSPTAAAITGVWAELLHCPATKIGMFDSFFSLGGHSLLLAQMAQMLSVRCNRRLTIADLFRLRDVASIAAWLDAPPDERSAIQAAEERAQQRRKHLASRVRSNQAGTGNC